MAEVEWIRKHGAEEVIVLGHGENQTFRESTQDGIVYGE